MKITLFGLAGTGTTSVGKLLAQRLNYVFNSSGNMARAIAKEQGLSIYEFDQKNLEEGIQFDIDLDRKIAYYGKNQDNFVFESRLAWYFIPDSVKIKLVCDDDITYQRIANRENLSLKEAKEKTIKRARELDLRYNKAYPQIKYPPQDSEFDLVLDSSLISIENLTLKIIDFLEDK